jgi:hypothetical protein
MREGRRSAELLEKTGDRAAPLALSSTITCARLTPRFRRVIWLIFSFARLTLLGEIPSLPFNSSRWPRNFRSPTGATALFPGSPEA